MWESSENYFMWVSPGRQVFITIWKEEETSPTIETRHVVSLEIIREQLIQALLEIPEMEERALREYRAKSYLSTNRPDGIPPVDTNAVRRKLVAHKPHNVVIERMCDELDDLRAKVSET